MFSFILCAQNSKYSVNNFGGQCRTYIRPTRYCCSAGLPIESDPYLPVLSSFYAVLNKKVIIDCVLNSVRIEALSAAVWSVR